MNRKPLVAIVGRPNVGKSALFNRLIGERLAIVDETPGTTRDRLQADSIWNGCTFTVIDTGGIDTRPGLRQPDASAGFLPQIRQQAEIAVAEADAILFVVDAETGITPADQEVAGILRTHQRDEGGAMKPAVFVVANKADNEARRQAAVEFFALGLGEVYPLSAIHGVGTGEVLDALVESFPPLEVEDDESVKIAIVGRPNVGKSSLLNALLGEERAIVSPLPGTTRDAIDTHIQVGDLPVTLIDTAGIRRRGHIDPGVEKYSVLRALRAIQRCDVALLLIDAVDGVTAQDAHVAGFILEESKSVVLVVNKWDVMTVEDEGRGGAQEKGFGKTLRAALNFLDYVPVIFISAKTGLRVEEVLPLALRVQEERLVRIPTAELNRIVREAVDRQAPPTKAGKRLRIYYASQVRTDPPTFLFHVNDTNLVHFSYERYLENQIRKAYGFLGTPLRLSFRPRSRATE
jgi:GTP-binding protein